MSQLLYVRHGQASYGKADYDQLSPLGYKQGTALGEYLIRKEHRFDVLYVGQLKRHYQTLEMVQAEYDKAGAALPAPIEIAALNEHRGPSVLKALLPQLREHDKDIAIWQSELEADPSLKVKNGLLIFDRAMDMWAAGKLDEIHPPEFEKWPVFRKTVEDGFDKMIEDHHQDKGINIGCFTSGGTISATLGKVMGIEDHARVISLNGIVQNASLSEIVFSGRRVTLKSFNKVPHLTDDMLTYV